MFSSFAACCLASLTSRNLPWRNSAISRALRSSPSTITSSPACGTSDRPWISTGIDGPASVDRLAVLVEHRAHAAEDRAGEHHVAALERAATAPGRSPPGRGPCRGALRSPRPWPARRPAPSARAPRPAAAPARASSSMPSPVLAETGTNGDSPPYSSGTTPCATSSCLTRSGFASGLSILLIATTIGTLAALACAIASMVCGITPSSAATTRITMSVTFAPRARIAVNASWPGVSRNVTMPRGVST